jgi:hypothetical protein
MVKPCISKAFVQRFVLLLANATSLGTSGRQQLFFGFGRISFRMCRSHLLLIARALLHGLAKDTNHGDWLLLMLLLLLMLVSFTTEREREREVLLCS